MREEDVAEDENGATMPPPELGGPLVILPFPLREPVTNDPVGETCILLPALEDGLEDEAAEPRRDEGNCSAGVYLLISGSL